ncbi:MAG TPA: PDZ domain-containing protein [Planctomycetota bacterium]|nr:PDZ domain-containing protein [Planctomycetota bacterium]
MRLRALALALAPLCLAAAAQDRDLVVSYTVFVDKPESGAIGIEMEVQGNAQEVVRVAIPAWAPGAYRIREYHKAVKQVKAHDGSGRALKVERENDLTWRIEAGDSQTVGVAYELEVEKNRLDPEHCLIHGPDTYLYVVGRKEAPCRVRFIVPEGWRIATGLELRVGTYRARDYDTFIDAPTEIGKFEVAEFDQDGARYELAIHAKGPVDTRALTEMCRKIVREQNAMFGGPPFDRYVFFYHFGDGFGGGGLEHLNSTTISGGYAAVSKDPMSIASVTSHEYFHVWNVKRIRPAELGPFDYTGIVRSKALWLSEGGTSYFGSRALARSRVWTEEQYFRHLAGEIETLQNNPDRRTTTVEKASQVTWDREDWPRVDYYNKGELLGLLIDLRTRRMSEGRLGFDDVMRHLNREYALQRGHGPIGVGFPEDGILKALNDVTGSDWGEFYSKYVSGLDELPFEEVLGASGLAVELKSVRRADLGLSLRRTTVATVPAGSEAERKGVKAQDRILAVNGEEVARGNLRELLTKLKPADSAKITFGRGNEKYAVNLTVGEREHVACSFKRAEAPTDLQRRILAGWLGPGR